MTTDFDNMPALTKPRDEAWSNWQKFNKVGDSVSGYIVDVFFRPEEVQGTQTMKPQRGLTLKQKDGTLINVGIKWYSFVLAGTDNLRLGDPVKITFSAEKPATQKMFKPTKIFTFNGVNMPENADKPTVKELTDLDAAKGGTKTPAPETHEEGGATFDDFKEPAHTAPPMTNMPPTA